MRKYRSQSSDEAPSRRGRNQAFGKKGESAAADWYTSRGYELIARNWRCREGEIDLIVRSQDDLVFCEVKSRSSGAFGEPVEAVTPQKQLRLRKLAMLYLSSGEGAHAPNLRFDVASVRGESVTVVENAF